MIISIIRVHFFHDCLVEKIARATCAGCAAVAVGEVEGGIAWC